MLAKENFNLLSNFVFNS